MHIGREEKERKKDRELVDLQNIVSWTTWGEFLKSVKENISILVDNVLGGNQVEAYYNSSQLSIILIRGINLLFFSWNSANFSSVAEQALQNLFACFEQLNLFETADKPQLFYTTCRFLAKIVVNIEDIFEKNNNVPISIIANIINGLEQFIWRKEDILQCCSWQMLYGFPYALAAYLLLACKWIRLFTQRMGRELLEKRLSSTSIDDLVQIACYYPIFYVRQRAWELLFMLQRDHVFICQCILKYAGDIKVIENLVEHDSQLASTLRNYSYFIDQCHCTPSIESKKVVLRYLLLNVLSAWLTLCMYEDDTLHHFVSKVGILWKYLSSKATGCVSTTVDSQSIEYFLAMLYIEQDDQMIEMLQIVLQLYKYYFWNNMYNQSSVLEIKSQKEAFLNIHRLWFSWLEMIHFDADILFDLCISSETELLAFLMSYLNVLSHMKTEELFIEWQEHELGLLGGILEELATKIQRLQSKHLMPFPSVPLLRKLQLVVSQLHHCLRK